MRPRNIHPMCSIYGIFAYVWFKSMVNVGTVNILYMDHMGTVPSEPLVLSSA